MYDFIWAPKDISSNYFADRNDDKCVAEKLLKKNDDDNKTPKVKKSSRRKNGII